MQTRNVELSQRGKGVQAKLIPEILNYIAIKEKSLTSRTTRKEKQSKKYFIWGFEEPENSYEYKNAQLLAKRFQAVFSSEVQIFITTYSFNFLSMMGENVAKYRVWHDGNVFASRISRIAAQENGAHTTIDLMLSDSDKLNDELGVFALNADLEKVFKDTLDLKNSLESKMKEIEQQTISLLVEDKYDQIYKIAWLKLNDYEFTEDNIDEIFKRECHFSILGLGGVGAVAGLLRMKNPGFFSKIRMVGLFDFDKEGSENFCHLKKESFWGEVEGSKFSGHYRKRTDHKYLYAMLLPIPERIAKFADIEHANFANYVEIENLLPEEFLVKNNFIERKKAVGTEYFKVKEGVKGKLWKKAIKFKKKNFTDFQSLFDTFDELIKADE